MRKWIKEGQKQIKNNLIVYGVTMLIIGITGSYCYIEVKNLFTEYAKATILIEHAQAYEVSRSQNSGETQAIPVASEAEASPNIHANGDLVSLVKKYFPDNQEQMMKLIACESRNNPENIGDESLTFWHNGQLYGKSIGLLQIRTGGKEKGKVWTRTENVQEFEKKMTDPEENLKMAKKIFDSQGYYGWYNCAKGNNLI